MKRRCEIEMNVQDIIDMIQLWNNIRQKDLYDLWGDEESFNRLKDLVSFIERIKGEKNND